MQGDKRAIADVLDAHDIDDYCDDDGTSGIYCIKCGWKGTYQREANEHLAEIVVAELDLDQRDGFEGFLGPVTRHVEEEV